MSISNLVSKLRSAYPTAERDGFSFAAIDSALAIHIKGTDVHPSLRDHSSNKDQIDLTYGATLPEGTSPVDDFFPTVVRPKHFPQSRHLKIPCSVWGECLSAPTQQWVTDENDVVRLERNDGLNPSLQLRGVDPLRRNIAADDWLIFVHRTGRSDYEAFSLKQNEWANPSGRSKEVLLGNGGIPSRVDFRLEALEGVPVVADLSEKWHERFVDDCKTVGLVVRQPFATRFIASLLAKRFLVLTGLAGSGKTRLAQAFARWIIPDLGWVDSTDHSKGKKSNLQYALVPVGADWTGNENIVGYPDGLRESCYVTKPSLELIRHALEPANAKAPHFLILDEMNLSHVERYFADLLSAIESGEEIPIYDGPDRKTDEKDEKNVPQRLRLPDNLFIVGTVNVDETTYMFSPKVLDRANVIEFRMNAVELEGFLDNPAKPDLSKLDGKGKPFGTVFVDAASNPVAVPADVKAAYEAEMLLLFKALQGHGAEFGYRTAYEAARFVHFYKLLGDGKVWKAMADDGKGAWSDRDDEGRDWFKYAMDCVVFQKLLPKLHGSRAKLGPVLKKLWFLCVNDTAGRDAAASTDNKKAEPSVDNIPLGAPYPLSAEKIGRMWRLLNENGFASFAEA